MTSLPALFLPHGSPPIPIEPCASSDWLAKAAALLPRRPTGIVFMSPHFVTPQFCVSTTERPVTLMDFDAGTDLEAVKKLSKLSYPCPGAPALGLRVAALLRSTGLACVTQDDRGLDHGVWTPLYVMYPDADIPVCCLSVRSDLDAAAHIQAGRALADLRKEGVLVVGSGEVVHNVPEMGARASAPKPWCLDFESWIEEQVLADTSATGTGGGPRGGRQADAALCGWKEAAPYASVAHPEDSPGEHLVPFFFAHGAGGPDCAGKLEHKEYLGSLPMSAYSFTTGG